MCSDKTAIRIQSLSKCYELYDQPRDRLKQSILSRLQRWTGRGTPKNYFREFWALREVTFDVKKGETVGIIGRNGSGKSTLLQLICGILSPTYGSVEIQGRVAALLELGAGFNPEFTGRENVYMNGVLLGLSQKEIDDRFDAIASFADIGDFIEQPIRTYSSGMYVRLAFAVIAHVDADILVIDEALAVGDIRFQQKCLRKLREMHEQGKTILFVSHDLGSINNFCDSVYWLHEGKIKHYGSPEEITKEYFSFMVYDDASSARREFSENIAINDQNEVEDIEWDSVEGCSSFGEGKAQILGSALYTQNPFEKVRVLDGKQPVILFLNILIKQSIDFPLVGFILNDKLGNHILGMNNAFLNHNLNSFGESQSKCVCFHFQFPALKNGDYTFSPAIAEGTLDTHIQQHWVHDAYIINVNNRGMERFMGWYFGVEEGSINVKE